ncbi:protein of unknown function [Hyphomicrobium sp. MC1]|nr:protein of unknown function [Hyphomicrobium sp. MC1]
MVLQSAARIGAHAGCAGIGPGIRAPAAVLTEFDVIDVWRGADLGIPFGSDHPFTYHEGKRILSLAMSELRQRGDLQGELGMNPSTPGRPSWEGAKTGYGIFLLSAPRMKMMPLRIILISHWASCQILLTRWSLFRMR